ncbi:apiosidase-like domain-containing protein [Paenibacillus nasutitermitis]|uniref:F5/8 type C domain-containing protein n=1 Tax=Paenibacillus nasutitermitis TaxID=1652958 RepID=A0A916YU54_9BACL|nr:DUF4038 domain-containing protein [Paenibacillus nasutitermitis]GGD60374.1 hypothetical protein GCM10010911_17830 [Paenibacillus nasutitermitis]
MKRRVMLWMASVLIFSSLVVTPLSVYVPKAHAAAYTTELWKAVDIILHSSKSYSNPYIDVEINATFIGPGGISMTLPGFWDGGDTWKFRFAPTVTGNWSYATTASDPTDTGLHGQTGTVVSQPYTGSLEIYKHGFVKADSSNRFLTYNDGTPFYWLADTHWMGLSYREKWGASNDPRWSSQYKGMVDQRVKQGYSVYQMNFFAFEQGDVDKSGTYNEGGHVWNYTRYDSNASSFITSSSQYDSYVAHPSKALDEREGTMWKAASNTYPQWFSIDLKSVTALGKIDTLFGENDTWKYKIEGSADNITYTTLADRTTGVSGDSFSDSVTANVRYVKITITGTTGGSTPSIREFKAYNSAGSILNWKGFASDLNPGFWQNSDLRIQYAIDKGLVVALGIDWGRLLDSGNEADYKRMARYIVARYGAYPTVWTGGGEYGQGSAASWKNVLDYTYSIDAYKRANTLHNDYTNTISFRNDNAYHFDFLQGGHGVLRDKSYWLEHYNATPTKVVIEGEANYENINGIPSSYTRETAWNANMAGSAGFSYGSEGLWQATWDSNDIWQVWGGLPTPWYEAIDKQAGEQMRYMKDFFEAVNWWTLQPNNSVISWSGAPTGTQEPAAKTNTDRSSIVAYLPSTTTAYNGTLNGLNASATYMAKWMNPRTGKYTTINAGFSPNTAGQWSIPPQPSVEDWTLWVARISNSVASPVMNIGGGTYDSMQGVTIASDTSGATIHYTTDGSTPTLASPVYTSPLLLTSPHPETIVIKAIAVKSGMVNSPQAIEYYKLLTGNLALNRTYSSSSQYDINQTAGKAFDGTASNWQAASGNYANEWLQVDFGSNVTFNTAIISEYGNRTTGFRIEYWNGTTWATAYTGTSIGNYGSPRTITFPAVTASKARLYFTAGTSFQPIIYEFELLNRNHALNLPVSNYSSSSQYDSSQSAYQAFDGSPTTNWQASNNLFSGQWLAVDFGQPVTFSKAVLTEYGNRTTGYRIDYWSGSTWTTAYTGTTIGDVNTPKTVTFPAVTGSKARLYFISGTGQPIIYEFAVY